jgi:hypothetical protein
MKERNASALKEWAAIEQALATGEISLLLRKGGIWEKREGFEVEHREFWIFPTLYHQNPDELAPQLRWLLESARASHPEPDQVRISLYLKVEDALRVESIEALQRLEGLHPLTQPTVEARFAYRNKPYLHALLVRAYRVPEPYLLPNTLDYEGCISWVELDEALATHGALPVLSDGEFAARRTEILDRLGKAGVVRL